MELLNGIKSLLASLTSKTSTNIVGTDGVMIINAGDGTPNGRLSVGELKKYLGGLNPRSASELNNDLNNALPSSVYNIGINITENVPSPSYYALLSIGTGDIVQILVHKQLPKAYFRQYVNGAWTIWREFTIDMPTFYNSYANLAALATGIMGQTISSITAAYFQGTIAQAVFDNVFIAVTRLSDTYPLAVKPKDWSTYSSASAYHVDGVLLVSGDKHLVIAPNDTSLAWGANSDTHAASGNTTIVNRDVAMAKFDGKTCTDTAVQVSEYSDATTACGYCHAFTTVTSAYNTSAIGYQRRKAGMWWLPSLGEMMMIWSNMIKINQVMSLIGGTAITDTTYWTSTETTQTSAWFLMCSNGTVGADYGKKNTSRVRPVCAF